MTTRTPTVTGPVPGDLPPYGAPPDELLPESYVVEEYQFEGSTVAYAFAHDVHPPIDGRWDVDEAAEATYRTRLLVVRPDDAARFNGTVVVAWQNVSAGYEIGSPPAEALAGGAWVGVSAQEVGLYGHPAGMAYGGARALPLLEHDPQRYGTLLHPGDQGSFDIFTQAGRAVGPRRSGDVDPLAGLPVQRTIAVGGSQSAMRLVAYLNAVHPHAGVFDGFVLSVWEGRAPRPEIGAIGMGVRTAIRDQPTPVIVVNSEFEAPHLSQLPVHDTEHLRVWEVAGTPHAPVRSHIGPPDTRGLVGNPLSITPVHEAALRAMHQWLATGTPAPAQPRITIEPGTRPSIRRDDDGNAIGGIRLPELAVPTHEYRGMAFGTGRAPLFGSARPFSDDDLRVRYPDRAKFTERWNSAVDELVASGALRPEDAPPMRARADEVKLPVD